MHKQPNCRVFLDQVPVCSTKAHHITRTTHPFEWGRQSPGAAQLALALLLEVVPEQQAKAMRFVFAAEVIAKLPHHKEPLSISRHEIMEWIAKKQNR